MEKHSFQEVMRQWGRMCNSNADCGDCPMRHKTYCLYRLASERSLFARQSEIENIVMQWAAAHPEPVYPTWGEWLMQFDVMGRTCQDMPNPYFAKDKAASPIPADIAQKFGIEPKEVCQ